MAGGVVSRTVTVCTQVELLPHRSVARQVRVMVRVGPQLIATESVKLIAALPQLSVAVATPVAFVVVIAGHSSVTEAGHAMTGGVVSITVTVWLHVAWL